MGATDSVTAGGGIRTAAASGLARTVPARAELGLYAVHHRAAGGLPAHGVGHGACGLAQRKVAAAPVGPKTRGGKGLAHTRILEGYACGVLPWRCCRWVKPCPMARMQFWLWSMKLQATK